MRSPRPILAGLVVLAAVAFGLLGPSGLFGPPGRAPGVAVSAPPVPSPAATRAAVVPTASHRPLSADEQAFADAYLGLAESYDRQVSDLLIANPLAEFDLVGTRLTDLVDLTRGQLAGLPALALTAGQVEELEREMAAAVALLRGIDPHGPAVERATTYQRALDYWIEHVRPLSDAIRAAVGLPPSASGDLRL